MLIAVRIDSFEADALEDRMDAKAAGELAHALDRLIAALADDVGCAELSRECDPVGMPAQHDDLLGAEAPAAMTPHKPTAPSPTTPPSSPERPWRRRPHDGRSPSRLKA